jgi:hypothetical protein
MDPMYASGRLRGSLMKNQLVVNLCCLVNLSNGVLSCRVYVRSGPVCCCSCVMYKAFVTSGWL